MTDILTASREKVLSKREKETRKAIKQGKAHNATSVKEMLDVLENTSHKHE